MARLVTEMVLWMIASCIVVGLEFPIERKLVLNPGTTVGFEYSEENLFEFLSFSGTVDCVYYSYSSTRPMNAALWFQHWSYLEEYALNYTVPPVDKGIVPGSWCKDTTTCLVDFEEGNLPQLDNKFRSGLNAVPYTIVFWYGLENTESTEVNLVVDGPCYTGVNETFTFPGETVTTTQAGEFPDNSDA